MVSPHRDFAAESEAEDIRRFAAALEGASDIAVKGAGRVPGMQPPDSVGLTPRGKEWIIAGLRLLADSKV